MNNVKLMPCICGGKAYLNIDYSSELDKTYYEVYCTNNKCFMKNPATLSAWDGKIFGTDWCDSKQEAIDKWNELIGDTIN